MQMRIVRLLTLVTLLLAAGMAPALAQQGPPPAGGAAARPAPPPPLQLTSTAISDGGTIPDKYTCSPDGKTMTQPANMTSPPLAWTGTPPGTKSFVLLLHDPDAHARKSFDDITHWMIFNIPGDATSLPEGVKADSTVGVQAGNVTGQPMFFGPCAPSGPVHHYTFELFALDSTLDLQKGASRDDVQKAMEGHVLTGTVLIGLFHHQPGFQFGPPPAR